MTLACFTGWEIGSEKYDHSQYDPRIDFGAEIVSRGAASAAWARRGCKVVSVDAFRGSGNAWASGKVDGVEHKEDVQTGKRHNLAVWGMWMKVPCGPYAALVYPSAVKIPTYFMVPSEAFTEFRIKEILQALARLSAQGITPYGLEIDEPYYANRAGYEESFRREWRRFYSEEWRDPESSEEARYMAEALKSFMLKRMASRISQAVKEHYPYLYYCVNPHSPFNHASDFIPRSIEGGSTSICGELLHVEGLDWVLGEVWTETIRFPVVYAGRETVAPFYHSLLERSYFHNLGHNGAPKVFQLIDPKSDNVRLFWGEIRRLCELDVLAALIVGGEHFWIAWPDRFYLSAAKPQGPVPEEYRTVFSGLLNVMRDMEKYPLQQEGLVGIPVADTIMWFRGEPGKNHIDDIYALSFPLYDQGILVETFPLEKAALDPSLLERFQVLLVSFESWLPSTKEQADRLIQWVKDGGVLVYFGLSHFDEVKRGWWRQQGFTSPRTYLFERLGLRMRGSPRQIPIERLQVTNPALANFLGESFLDGARPGWIEPENTLSSLLDDNFLEPPALILWDAEDATSLMETGDGRIVSWMKEVGQGRVVYVGISPYHLAYGYEGIQLVSKLTEWLLAELGHSELRHSFDVSRGPYRAIYARDVYRIEGLFLDLLDHRLPVVEKVSLGKDDYKLLMDIAPLLSNDEVKVLFSSGVIVSQEISDHRIALRFRGLADTLLVTALSLGGRTAKQIRAYEDGTDKDLKEWVVVEKGVLKVGHRGSGEFHILEVEW